MNDFELPPLPYAYDALAPHVGEETLRYHHDAHHAKYVHTLNALMTKERIPPKPLADVVRDADGKVFDMAAQAWNHEFYWSSMSPKGGGEPDEGLATMLSNVFGSVDAFREEFAQAAKTHFGSGWAWLVASEKGQLEIVTTHDAGCPLTDGATPLLTCDVWEHAYYLDHRNDRGAYLDAFFEVVDWEAVSRRVDETSLIQGVRGS